MQSDTIDKPQTRSTVATMNAVRVHRYGGPEVLSYDKVQCPQPGPGEVLIRARAAGVNPLDWKFRNGYVKDLVPLPLPAIPGWDFAGVVAATGPFVEGLKPGNEVFGMSDLSRAGAYAEYIVVGDQREADPSLEGPVVGVFPKERPWHSLQPNSQSRSSCLVQVGKQQPQPRRILIVSMFILRF